MAKHSICEFQDCANPANIRGGAKGFCSKHYLRFKKYGDPSFSKLDRETAVCQVAGCERGKPLAKGYCPKHYKRLEIHGTTEIPRGGQYKRKISWLREYVNYSGDECLIWPFTVSDNGRGVADLDGRTLPAPRIMCILAHGEPEDESFHAAHSCGKGHLGCVSPHHLGWKTPQENEADKRVHGTLRKGSAINTAVLTETDVQSIRAMIVGGISGKEIARRFGTTPSAISSIKTRKSWAWLE